ncbi:MAG: cysteine desulfurase [Saprospiraceae bacterium]|uniref:cysteine desulfurase n=1 Tax=Candidatus Opimibacter skivensis TaxID=2982028 RepID=A0A9D7SQN2_9BACT|nr:cysteine desulfurase [Candidatus Opimibacter skivensis]
MGRRVYLDNAATTPLRPEVLEVMMPFLTGQFGNPSSIHQDGRTTRAAIENSRKTVANLIGASTGEIFFTSGGTESNNMAIKCAVSDLGVTRIITSPAEHHCVKHSVEHLLAKNAVHVDFVKIDKYGLPDFNHLESLLATDNGKTLVTLMHANNELGSMLDLQRLSELCHKYGAWLHSDTVQTVGHFPINVKQTPVDFISGASHKFYGPKGIGFIYINSRCHIHPYIDGGSQERNMRAGTENICGIIGLAKAMQLAYAELEEDKAHINGIKQYMKDQLIATCPGILFNGHPSESLYTVLNVSFPPDPQTELMVMSLDIAGISASGGSACSSGAESQSHVLEAIGHPSDRTPVRFSFSRNTTKDDIDFAVHQISGILAGGVHVTV